MQKTDIMGGKRDTMTKSIEEFNGPRKVLNVGGGDKRIPIPEIFSDWQHDLLDIDPHGKPELLCDARDLYKTSPRVYDAIYCSHNLEHYYHHEVPRVLMGFKLALKKDGFAFIKVPDMLAVMKAVIENGLDIEDVLYNADCGPILVRDVIYGFNIQIERSGNDFYAHKTGFTKKSLNDLLTQGGFPYIFAGEGLYEIKVLAFKQKPNNFQMELLGL
jgi:hypothetical protein